MYWFIVRPKTYGVKMVIENEGKLLMIRNTYGHKKWTFPGGGKNKNETPQNGAIREASEEVGINAKSPKYLGEYLSTRQNKRDTVYCFYTKVNSTEFKIDPSEIEEAQWFGISDIPQEQSPAVQGILKLYLNQSGSNTV